MSKFLSRQSEGWQCARDTAFNRIMSDVQANKFRYKKVKSLGGDLIDEVLSDQKYKQYEMAIIRDELTGLYNTHYFTQKLTKELKRSKRYKRPFSIMLVSMDKMPQLQKLYGNLLACQILQQEAKTLLAAVREVDLVFRVGPEQFAVLLPETYASKACIVAERICQQSRSKSVSSRANTVMVTVSLGIASFPTHGRQEKELLCTAKEFLDKAQSSGGNRICSG